MPRYLIFSGYMYYPDKGVGDLFGMSDDREEAIGLAESRISSVDVLNWVQVADLQELTIIWQKEISADRGIEESHTIVDFPEWNNV